jgi:Ala-tRNA(Pro) deacylase
MAVPAKISTFLSSKGVTFEAVEHAETLSSVEEAQALGIEAGEVAKVIVVRHGGRTALFALPAGSRTDMKAVREALGDKNARFATEEEMAQDLRDYALGSVPPFSDLVGATLYLDRHLADHQTVVFAAGTHTDSIKMAVADLRALGPHDVGEFCRAKE